MLVGALSGSPRHAQKNLEIARLEVAKQKNKTVLLTSAGIPSYLDGRQLVDDFAIHTVGRAVHVLNAPSPAATASLEIGATIAQRLGLDDV